MLKANSNYEYIFAFAIRIAMWMKSLHVNLILMFS